MGTKRAFHWYFVIKIVKIGAKMIIYRRHHAAPSSASSGLGGCTFGAKLNRYERCHPLNEHHVASMLLPLRLLQSL